MLGHDQQQQQQAAVGEAEGERRGGFLPRPALRSAEERNRLAEANVGLVSGVLSRLRLQGHPAVEDLEAAGIVGLLRACELWDQTRGYTLATFADHHIRNGVLAERRRLDLIRLPPHVRGDVRRELRERLRPARLSRLVRHDGARAYEVADARPDDDLAGADVRDAIEAALRRLPRRWADVLRMRYLEEPPRHQSEVGEALGVSRERVRQLEAAALAKLARLAPHLAELLPAERAPSPGEAANGGGLVLPAAAAEADPTPSDLLSL